MRAAAIAVLIACLVWGLVGSVPRASATGAGDLTCSLALTKTDPTTVNIAYPDEAAVYYSTSYAAVPGTRIRISGGFPHARYMSFTVYDPAGRPLDALADVQLTPDEGFSNPFLAGADRTVSRRSYTAFVDFGPIPKAPAPNTLYTGSGQNGLPNYEGILMYRIYIPDTGRDDSGGVGLPTVTLESTSTTTGPGPSACAGVQRPAPVDVNTVVAASNGLPVTPPGATGAPVPVWTKFVNLPQAVAAEAFSDPYWDPFRATFNQIPLDQLGGSGGFLSNLDNAYLTAAINPAYGPILVTRFRAPTFPNTRPGTPAMSAGQVRYFSMCQNDPVSERFIACATDDETAVDDGYVTYLVSTPANRPANATARCGVTWIPWGPDPNGVLIYRNMLADPSFAESIQHAKPGSEQATMGAYFPQSKYYPSRAAFEQLGCAPPPRASVPPARCAQASGRLSGLRLGPVRLGMTRARIRRLFSRVSTRGRRYMEFICLTPAGIRVGYPSAKLLQALPRGERAHVRGRVVLALTSNPRYALRGVRPGERLAAAQHRLRTGAGFHIGLNWWYLASNGASTGLLKVRRGVIEEVGVADKRLAGASHSAALRFLRSFT